jgi:carboxyl-terminal processing protease
MKTFRQAFLISLLTGLGLITAFIAGYLLRDHQVSDQDLPILLEAKRLLIQHAYNPLPTDPSLEYGMIRGMLQASNDPYNSFSEPVQHELTTNNLAGKFGGIGVQLQRDQEGYTVLIPIADGPAIQAGLLEGDRLIRVDAQEITTETPTEMIQAALRGEVGTSVLIVIQRPPDFVEFSFPIKRAEFNLPSVTSYLSPVEPRLGVMKVNLMAETTPQEIVDAVHSLQERGAQSFALDLRDNFGGLLTSGIETARLFLQEGIILQEQFKDQKPKTYTAEETGRLAEIPLAVLVNQNTASAAEIAAGALQARGRAVLIGTRTYGKDTVQLVFELQDQSSLQITAARWWIPGKDGEVPASISGVGLQPDIKIDEQPSADVDPVMLAAIAYLFKSP